MYRILSAKGNPQLSSLNTLLDALGLKLAIETKKARSFAVAEESWLKNWSITKAE